MTNIIKVQFFKGGTPAGKAYSYYTPEPVDVGDIVDIKTNHGTARATQASITALQGRISTAMSGKYHLRAELDRQNMNLEPVLRVVPGPALVQEPLSQPS